MIRFEKILGERLNITILINITIKVVASLINFLFTIYIVKSLGITDYGTFAMIYGISVGITTFSGCGLETVVLKESSILPSSKSNTAFLLLFNTLLISLSVIIILFIIIWILQDAGFIPEIGFTSFSAFLFIAIYTTTNHLTEYLKGIQKQTVGNFLNGLLPNITALIYVTSMNNVGVYDPLIALTNGYSLGMLFSLILIYKKSKVLKLKMQNPVTLISKGKFFLLINICLGSFLLGDIYIIGLFLETDDVAIYNLNLRVVLFISIIMSGLNVVVTPLIAKYYSNRDFTKLRDLCRKLSLSLSIFSGVVFIIFVIFGRNILSAIGDDFVESYNLLLIIVAGHLINISFGPTSYILSLTGNETFFTKILFLVVLLNIIVNLIIVDIYGVIGVATTTSVCWFLLNLSSYLIIRKKVVRYIL